MIKFLHSKSIIESAREQFAGLMWPRHLAILPTGPMAQRLERRKNPCTGKYFASLVITDALTQGKGFYLGDIGQPGPRWDWADEVSTRIKHTGWFADDHQNDKIRGVVIRLPHGRFLAGWALQSDILDDDGTGGMAAVSRQIFTDEVDAANDADDQAADVAECMAATAEQDMGDDE